MASMMWLKNVEPTVDDMLSDPIVLLALGRHSSPESLRALLQSVARSRAAADLAPPVPQPDPAG